MRNIYSLLALCLIGISIQAQTIPNYRFESWSGGTTTAPDGWTTSGNDIPGFAAVSQSTDMYEGDFAARMECKIVGTDTSQAWISTLRPGGAEGFGPAFPVSTAHTTIKGYYKYNTAMISDSAMVIVGLFKTGYNHSGGWGNLLAFGWVNLPAAATYTPFTSTDFMYDSLYTPDSAYIDMGPYQGIDVWTGASLPVTGNSTLWVDAISFDSYIVANDPQGNYVSSCTLYPSVNDGSFQLSFDLVKGELTTIRIYDLEGRQHASLFEGMLGSGSHTLQFSLDALSSGNYFVLVSSPTGYHTERLTIQR